MKLSRLNTVDSGSTLSLWRHGGSSQSGGESETLLISFLRRNPGLSFKVTDRERIVATALCSHDGRRGYLHHLAIAPGYAHRNIGPTLVKRCLAGLGMLGVSRCHVFIASDNQNARELWTSLGGGDREKLEIYSHDIEYPQT